MHLNELRENNYFRNTNKIFANHIDQVYYKYMNYTAK